MTKSLCQGRTSLPLGDLFDAVPDERDHQGDDSQHADNQEAKKAPGHKLVGFPERRLRARFTFRRNAANGVSNAASLLEIVSDEELSSGHRPDITCARSLGPLA
jgi:hypothetical protein